MSEELETEIEAINAIYGAATIQKADEHEIYILSISKLDTSLRLRFPPEYPDVMPCIVGTESTGDQTRKGYGRYVIDLARDILIRIFTPGLVCLYDLLQELDSSLIDNPDDHSQASECKDQASPIARIASHASPDLEEPPQWCLSEPITEKKSTFLARACNVTSPAHARACLSYLLATEKRVSKATHNITAYRIRCPTSRSISETTYQDCDDDGETAAGGRLLHLLQIMDVWGLLVVVTRWYGGVKLGPDRFSIINNLAREAVVKGGWTRSRTAKC